MLYLTGNLFVAVHQESKINIIKYIKINYLNIIYFIMLKCWGQGVGQVLVKYRSGIGRLLVDFEFFENFFRSCEEFFLFFRKQNKTLKRGKHLEYLHLHLKFEVFGLLMKILELFHRVSFYWYYPVHLKHKINIYQH